MILRSLDVRIFFCKVLMLCTLFWLSACSMNTGTHVFNNIKSYSPSAYYNWAESAHEDELTHEQLRLENAGTTMQSPRNIVQYAIVLSMTDKDSGMNIHEVTYFLNENLTDQKVRKNKLTNAYITFGLIWQRQLELEINNGNVKYTNSQADSRIKILEDKIQSLESTIRAFTDIEQEMNQREDNESAQ